MRYRVLHEGPGQLHLKLARGRLSEREADILYYALIDRLEVVKATVFARTGEVSIRVRHDPEKLLSYLDNLQLTEDAVKMPSVSGRATNEEFKEKIGTGKFLLCHWDGTAETEQAIKDATKATIRCIPVDSFVCEEEGKDIFSGKPSKQRVVFAISY